MVKKNNALPISVAILQTDLVWIKNKLSSIEESVNKIHACTSNHDNRIQSLEEWKKNCNIEWNKNMIRWGIIISAIAFIASTFIALFV